MQRGAQGVDVRRGGGVADAVSVSYTHLDVYKRQVCDLSHYSREAQDEWKGGWDPETGTLTLLMYYYVPPVRTS